MPKNYYRRLLVLLISLGGILLFLLILQPPFFVTAAPDEAISTSTTIDVTIPDTSVVGQSFVVTFTVRRTEENPNGYSIRGTVVVSDGAGDTCSYSWTGTDPVFTLGWMSQCYLTSHTAGVKQLVATFTPYVPEQFAGSVSAPFDHTVDKADTTAAVTYSPSPPIACSDVTLKATVSPVSPGGGTPSSGTVTFYEGAVNLGNGTYLGSAQWSLAITLPPGWHPVHAVYNGSSDYNGSTAPGVNFTVPKADSTIAITNVGSNPSKFGESITLRAASGGACGTPTGLVNFYDAGSWFGSASLNASGIASLVESGLSVGSHALTAAYAGDSAYNSSNSNTLTQQVNKSDTAAALVAYPTTAPISSTVTFTATLSAVSPGSGVPGGVVIFKEGEISLGSAYLNSAGKAIWLASHLATGVHNITAVYGGDASFNGSSSSPLEVTIQSQADVFVEKTSDPVTVYAGEQMDYQVAVTNNGPSAAQQVTVLDVLPDEISFQIDSSGACLQPVELKGLRAVLAGSNEVPPVSTPASGLATFVLDTSTNELFYSIQVSQIDNLTAGHIHLGAAGANGPIQVTLYNGSPFFDPTQPLVSSVVLSPSQAAALLANPAGYYVNLHTADYPAGEIRGQLSLSAHTPLKCALGSMQVSQTRQFDVYASALPESEPDTTITNVAIVTSATDLGDPLMWNNVSSAENLLLGKADLKATKYGKPDNEVRAGELLTYTILVDNLGPGVAHTVVLTDVLQSDGSFQIVSLESDRPADCDPTSGSFTGQMQLRCDLADPLEVMAPEASGRWKLVVKVTADEKQTINNTVDVVGADLDPNLSNNTAHVEHDITDVADLSILKSAIGEVQEDCQPGGTFILMPDEVTAGLVLTYTLTIDNLGPSTAENVEAQDRLPAWVEILAITPSQGSCNWGTPGDPLDKMACGLGNLSPSGNATVAIRLKIPSWVAGGTQLQNDALVLSDVFDPNNENNFASNQTTVDAWADLSVSKVQLPEIAVPGRGITYTITVNNTGPSDAAAAPVADLAPTELDAVSWICVTSGKAACTPTGLGNIIDQVDLPSGELVTYTLIGTLNTFVPFTNTVTVSAPTGIPDPYLENNQASVINTPVVYYYPFITRIFP